MAVVDCAIAVGGALGVGGAGIGAGLVGGAAIGAGIGGLYSGITGDGNVLNSMLNGALIGGGIGGGGAALGLTGATGTSLGLSGAGSLSGVGSALGLGSAAPGVVAPVAGMGAPALGAATEFTGGVGVGGAGGSTAVGGSGLAGATGSAIPTAMGPTAAELGYTGAGTASTNAAIAQADAAAAAANGGAGAGGIPSWAKWGAGLYGVNALMQNQNKKYGTLSPSQVQSLPLQYQSNFGTYKPLDTSVMRPMGAPAGYSGTPYGTPGYIGSPVGYAAGGIADANNGATPAMTPPGGPVEQMSRDNALGQNQMFPQSQLQSSAFSSPTNTPMGSNLIAAAGDTNVDPYTGAEKFAGGGAVQHYDLGGFIQNAAELPMNQFQTAMDNPGQALIGANTPFETNVWNGVTGSHMAPTTDMYGVPTGAHRPRYAAGGVAGASSLGGYAAGGNPRLLKGPGDGMSDNIPATISGKQPARLADGEFVVPADVVSHLGNGSTDAGAKHLYNMMDKVRAARTGNKKQGKQIKADKFLPK